MEDTSMPSTAQSPPPTKRKVPLDRIVLFSVLIILIGVLVFDYSARRQAAAADQRLDDHMLTEEEDTGEAETGMLTQDAVHEILGRDPVETTENGPDIIEKYSWPGAFRSYTLHVVYGRGKMPLYRESYLNQEPGTEEEE